MISRKAKPCPFCGCKDIEITTNVQVMDDASLHCLDCGMGTPAVDRGSGSGLAAIDAVTEMWNRRAPLAKHPKPSSD